MQVDDDPVRARAFDYIGLQAAFSRDGFVVIDHLIDADTCAALNIRLELVLRGECDGKFGRADKAPKFCAERRCKPGKTPPPLGGPSKQTLQVINVWKADTAFASIVLSPTLGQLVARLGGWAAGARIANDQVWAKPPGAAPLTFHRDSAYFDFTPPDVITVWLALDDMEPQLGPLQYVSGSHKWADGRVGSAQQFFDARNRFALLHDAARREGIEEPAAALKLTTLGVRMGGCGIHDGRLWHGSGANESADLPRRGLGIHFVPADARFADAMGRTLAHTLRPPDQAHLTTMSEALFPVTWRPRAADPARSLRAGGSHCAEHVVLTVTVIAADEVTVGLECVQSGCQIAALHQQCAAARQTVSLSAPQATTPTNSM